MPRLIIQYPGHRHQVLHLRDGELLVGRGEGAGLLLPDPSVSREHLRLSVSGQRVTMEPVGATNAPRVNGEKADGARELRPRDRLTVGRFELVLLGEGKEDRFHAGRYVAALPIYKAENILSGQSGPSTVGLSEEQLRMLQLGNQLVERARVVHAGDARLYWYPEEGGLSFGDSGQVPVEGWLTWGVLAQLSWDGGRHVIERQRWWATVSVNGESADRRPLKPGDQVQVGRSRFRYELDGQGA